MRTRHELWTRWSAGAAAGLMMTAVLTLGAGTARAQETAVKPMGSIPAGETYAVIPLHHIISDRDGNEVMTALRNVLNRARVYYVSTQHAVAILGTEADMEAARRMLAELDKPHQGYRLTYTITMKDGERTVDTRRYELALDASGHAAIKQGSRVPIVTGTTDAQSAAKSLVQYLDVGLMISVDLDGARLRSKVEESKLSANKSTVGAGDPEVEQTTLSGDTPLAVGKTLTVGSLDLPGTATTGTRREVVQVTAEMVE
ncbi:MAG TPA: hypothetical protein VFU55_00635 [Terracidiphilus sp.]|nr:hypothetical protein [Terracidiphilus sp.]